MHRSLEEAVATPSSPYGLAVDHQGVEWVNTRTRPVPGGDERLDDRLGLDPHRPTRFSRVGGAQSHRTVRRGRGRSSPVPRGPARLGVEPRPCSRSALAAGRAGPSSRAFVRVAALDKARGPRGSPGGVLTGQFPILAPRAHATRLASRGAGFGRFGQFLNVGRAKRADSGAMGVRVVGCARPTRIRGATARD